MPPQTMTKQASVSHHRKPETTPSGPPLSLLLMPTPSTSPSRPSAASVSHTRKGQRQHQGQFIFGDSSWSPAESSNQVDSYRSSPTSSRSSSYASLTSSPASSLGQPTLSSPEPLSKFNAESRWLLPPEIPSKPTLNEPATDRGPPCKTCHKPSTFCTVGPLNPKGNAGKKYFACRRCPFGLGWVGWADPLWDGVVVGIEKERGVGPVPLAGLHSVDDRGGSYANTPPKAIGEESLFNTGEVTKGWSLESRAAGDSKPTCCCGEYMRLEYVDLVWDVSHAVPGQERKKWYWNCARGGCAKFVWVEETGALALDERVGNHQRPETSVRILW
ncbi:hypothetical protein B0T20DRAFT_99165 [Sordaria brevicollis]|uniref:GRF-like zinc ribbon domain-containing protein n=1 Tax=Sordaria brevicollis TaxID=83679 RepID=A0AAE0U2W8_SORBR|nr:hypothetical protein B0T20DRAFT_99165 [Sordaria brevicollis]